MSLPPTGKTIQVKNRAPAEQQLTTEQILIDAQQYREEVFSTTNRKLTSKEEVEAYRASKRREFEQKVARGKHSIGSFIKYARWESEVGDLDRARSIWERAVEADPSNVTLWLGYADMEIIAGMVNFARNVLERGTRLIPLYAQLWLKWISLEERLNNIDTTRTIFEQFMSWRPSAEAWSAYVNFEVRHQNIPGARRVFEQFLVSFPEPETYLKYAKFEYQHGDAARTRAVYQRALRELDMDGQGQAAAQAETEAASGVVSVRQGFSDPRIWLAYADFEARVGQPERARGVFRAALRVLSATQQAPVVAAYTVFEKQHGGSDAIEEAVLSQRRLRYEATLEQHPHDYDTWQDYARLEEYAAADAAERLVLLARARARGQRSVEQESSTAADMTDDEPLDAPATVAAVQQLPAADQAALHARVRAVYSRAQAQTPPGAAAQDKRAWQRYIYLWLQHAVYEELVAGDVSAARAVYAACLRAVPHRTFTFAKLWVQAALLEVRAHDLPAARKLLGTALGLCPRRKVFEAYLSLERSLGEIDRCRLLLQRWVECEPTRPEPWLAFAELEAQLQEPDRARAVLEACLSQEGLEEPTRVWKTYLRLEMELVQEEAHGQVLLSTSNVYKRVRELYERELVHDEGGAAGVCVGTWKRYMRTEYGWGHAAEARAIAQRCDDRCKAQVQACAHAVDAGAGEAAQRGLAAREQRARWLQTWLRAEKARQGPPHDDFAAQLESRQPQKIKSTRQLATAPGADGEEGDPVYEEYTDYVFPDESAGKDKKAKALLDAAKLFKLKKLGKAMDTAAAKKEE